MKKAMKAIKINTDILSCTTKATYGEESESDSHYLAFTLDDKDNISQLSCTTVAGKSFVAVDDQEQHWLAMNHITSIDLIKETREKNHE